MRFGSVCSGIEAASVAWEPLGWRAAWFSEIEPFPSAVLAHHYPEVPNLGDMAALPDLILNGQVEAPDVFCGGTPCQAFSVAGLRRSLDDARGNLSLTFCEIANAIDHVRVARGDQPCIVFWENVPGVLSTKDNAFGCFLAGLAGEDVPLVPPGGKWTDAGCVLGPARAVAWRILDAQYFGVAQRRKRVFVVASARNDFDPAAVLLEWDGVRRDSAPSREKGEAAAHATAPCLTSSGRGVERTGDTRGQDPVVAVCVSSGQANAEIRTDGGAPTLTCLHEAPIVAHSLRGEGFDASEDGTGRGTPLVPVPFDTTQITSPANFSNQKPGDPCHPLAAGAHAQAVAHCVDMGGNKGLNGGGILRELVQPLGTNGAHAVQKAMQVRRLTPRECERLQGFPDDHTMIPWRGKPADQCPDGPRYKALGNSWAVPVVRWIGARIDCIANLI